MFMLWCCADADMLASGNAYRLSNTGGGLHMLLRADALCYSRVLLHACVSLPACATVNARHPHSQQMCSGLRCCIPAAYRPGAEPGAAGPAREQGHPQHPVALPAAAGRVGGLRRGAPGRPQRAERPALHRQIHAGRRSLVVCRLLEGHPACATGVCVCAMTCMHAGANVRYHAFLPGCRRMKVWLGAAGAAHPEPGGAGGGLAAEAVQG